MQNLPTFCMVINIVICMNNKLSHCTQFDVCALNSFTIATASLNDMGSQMAEVFGSRAINQKVASLIPDRAK